MPRLIVNADDLGYTSGVDDAVLKLAGECALSSATAMAIGSHTAQGAGAWLRAGLAVGCHVVLLDGKPVSPPQTVPSLLVQGVLRPTLGSFVRDLYLGRIIEDDIEREAIAQMRALTALGLQLTHVDTHKHTHMFAGVLRPVLRAAAQCGINAVRNPFEPAWSRAATRNAPLLRRLEVQLLSLKRRGFVRMVRRAGMRTTDGALGVLSTGTLNSDTLGSLLEALDQHARPGETYELVTHPAFADAELRARRTRLQAERQTEYEALRIAIPHWCASGNYPHTLANFANL